MNKLVIAAVVLLTFSACDGPVTEPPPEPIGPTYIWMMPRGDTLVELTTQIDKWKETLELIDVIGYADHILHKNYSDTQLRESFAVLKEHGLYLALEVGAIKEWGTTGASTFTQQKNGFWDRYIELGAPLVGIVMDEPLVAVHSHYKDYFSHFVDDTDEAKFEYAVEQTAEFMRLVRNAYPHWFIADIGVYPYFDADKTILWINALEARLAAKGVRGQDFFRLDVDWNHFRTNQQNYPYHWGQVKRIEDHCREIGLPFSLIYWAANVAGRPNLQADPTSWLTYILQMGERYQDVGGKPDQYVIQTWIPNIPAMTLPETNPHSFTYSVLEFNKQIIPPREDD